jgi:hypothetical protein
MRKKLELKAQNSHHSSPDPPIRLEAPVIHAGEENELAALAAFILTVDRIEKWNKL